MGEGGLIFPNTHCTLWQRMALKGLSDVSVNIKIFYDTKHTHRVQHPLVLLRLYRHRRGHVGRCSRRLLPCSLRNYW